MKVSEEQVRASDRHLMDVARRVPGRQSEKAPPRPQCPVRPRKLFLGRWGILKVGRPTRWGIFPFVVGTSQEVTMKAQMVSRWGNARPLPKVELFEWPPSRSCLLRGGRPSRRDMVSKESVRGRTTLSGYYDGQERNQPGNWHAARERRR